MTRINMSGKARIAGKVQLRGLCIGRERCVLGWRAAEGVEFIGGTNDVAAGESSNIVFVAPLEAGRYVMVCFLPDTDEGPEGTPHFAKGMVKEFTVE
jgi:hypothetical protein